MNVVVPKHATAVRKHRGTDGSTAAVSLLIVYICLKVVQTGWAPPTMAPHELHKDRGVSSAPSTCRHPIPVAKRSPKA